MNLNVDEDKKNIASHFHKVFWPDGAKVGVMTLGGSIYWRKLLTNFYTFVEDKCEKAIEIPRVPLVYHKNPFLHAKKYLGLVV